MFYVTVQGVEQHGVLKPRWPSQDFSKLRLLQAVGSDLECVGRMLASSQSNDCDAEPHAQKDKNLRLHAMRK
jgi:hypothetical protein